MERPDPNGQGTVKVAEHSDADELRAEQALIAAAGRLLRATAPGVPEDFTACLFARAVPEDLMLYDPRQLAARKPRFRASIENIAPGRTPGNSNRPSESVT